MDKKRTSLLIKVKCMTFAPNISIIKIFVNVNKYYTPFHGCFDRSKGPFINYVNKQGEEVSAKCQKYYIRYYLYM